MCCSIPVILALRSYEENPTFSILITLVISTNANVDRDDNVLELPCALCATLSDYPPSEFVFFLLKMNSVIYISQRPTVEFGTDLQPIWDGGKPPALCSFSSLGPVIHTSLANQNLPWTRLSERRILQGSRL